MSDGENAALLEDEDGDSGPRLPPARKPASRWAGGGLCGCAVFGTAVALLVLYGDSAWGSDEGHRLTIGSYQDQEAAPNWTWTCTNNVCQRRRLTSLENMTSQETCSMTCGLIPLWPLPKHVYQNSSSSATFRRLLLAPITPSDSAEYLHEAFEIFRSYITRNNASKLVDVEYVLVNFNVESDSTNLTASTNESYTLLVRKDDEIVVVNITAATCYGARHALETLSQLIWFDTVFNQFRILYGVYITDEPSVQHRGFHIDTARNFFSVASLKKLVDGMAANKLNVFHLHLTDATSFPVVLPNNQQFAEYGAYSEDSKYSVEDMKHLVEYARYRGIRTILEIDAPSHVYEGWTWDENLVICGEGNVFNGHLNPDYPGTYQALENIYRDLLELGTTPDTFHIGGDEVNLTCWADTATRSKFPDGYRMWADFTNRMVEAVRVANNGTIPEQVVLWSSPLTDSHIDLLDHKENLVVQYWFGKAQPILDAGVKVIFSTVGKWYLDCGFGPWRPGEDRGSCDPYTPWTKVYEYRPWSGLSAGRRRLVAGAEACLWSEQVAEGELQARAWPRGAAFAERAWSDPPAAGAAARAPVAARLQAQAARMRARGVDGAAVWPRWCSLNPERCR